MPSTSQKPEIDTIDSLIKLCKEKPLTKRGFEQILFTEATAEEGQRRQEQALKSIMRNAQPEHVAKLRKFITDNKITTLFELENLRNYYAKSGKTKDLESMGLETAFVPGGKAMFNYQIAHFETIDRINQLSDQTSNKALKYLIGTISIKLDDSKYSDDKIKDELSENLDKLSNTISHINSECKTIAESPDLNQEQKSEINKHKNTLVDETIRFMDNTLRDPKKVEVNKTTYMNNVKASEVACRSKIDDTVGRKVLRALTNFLSHVTIVGMVANVVNKCKTGNWLLFEHEKVSRDVKAVDNKITDEIMPTK
ncbi:hypothetical protein [Caedibacter taeniospiralis]|jgi:hypothetical protein|uniref:hypothetical protein n=1 Tax=Caedibacter taeniospiralis TaxID=28907 RepID=UPI0037BE3E2C